MHLCCVPWRIKIIMISIVTVVAGACRVCWHRRLPSVCPGGGVAVASGVHHVDRRCDRQGSGRRPERDATRLPAAADRRQLRPPARGRHLHVHGAPEERGNRHVSVSAASAAAVHRAARPLPARPGENGAEPRPAFSYETLWERFPLADRLACENRNSAQPLLNIGVAKICNLAWIHIIVFVILS